MSKQKNKADRSTGKGITDKKRHCYSKVDKKRYYEQWQSSGQSKAQFCRTHRIPSATFYKWVREFKSQVSSDSSDPGGMIFRSVKTEGRSSSLVPCIELHLTSGHYFRMPFTMDITRLKLLLDVIG